MNRWMSSTTGCNNLNAITMTVHDVLAVKYVYDVVAVINYEATRRQQLNQQVQRRLLLLFS